MPSDLENEVLMWRKKYENVEKDMSTLKKLAHKDRDKRNKAVADYEDLLRKYDQNQKQYEEIKSRLRDREEQLKKFQKMLEPVYNEYEQLETKYNIEKDCRSEAEKYATKIVYENKKLKRQSQYLLDKMNSSNINILEINFEEEKDSNDNVAEDQIVHLEKIIEDLRDNVAKLKHKAQTAEEERDLALDREKHAMQNYRQESDLLKNVRRVSTKAYEEYSVLKEKFEMEKNLKAEAEIFASQMRAETKSMKRQSAVLINNAMSDKKLADALLKIEELSQEIHAKDTQNKNLAKDVEDLLDKTKEKQVVSDLENNLQLEQINDLQKQIEQAQEQNKTILKHNEELRKKLDIAEIYLKPPAAPPLPPVIPAKKFLTPLKQMLNSDEKHESSGRKSSINKLEKENPNYTEALKEMMDRIKTGTALRSGNKRRPGLDFKRWETSIKPSLPEDQSSAMEDLHDMLANIRKRRPSADDIREITSESSFDPVDTLDNSELSKAFKKIMNRNLSTITEENNPSLSPAASFDKGDDDFTRM